MRHNERVCHETVDGWIARLVFRFNGRLLDFFHGGATPCSLFQGVTNGEQTTVTIQSGARLISCPPCRCNNKKCGSSLLQDMGHREQNIVVLWIHFVPYSQILIYYSRSQTQFLIPLNRHFILGRVIPYHFRCGSPPFYDGIQAIIVQQRRRKRTLCLSPWKQFSMNHRNNNNSNSNHPNSSSNNRNNNINNGYVLQPLHQQQRRERRPRQ